MSLTKKLVVYTCITGNYDTLREVKFQNPNIDYICFTDNANLSSKTWKIVPIPEQISLSKISDVKKQRLIKVFPNKWFKDYDRSLWIDSNIEIISDIDDFFSKYDNQEKILYVNKHGSRDCIYREQLAVIRLNKDTFENTNPQIARYHEEGFPEHYGLAETNILLRKHNDPKCVKLMNCWGDEILNGSHRDQLSFNYAVWKTNLTDAVEYLDEKYFNLKLYDNAFFKLTRHIRLNTELKPFTAIVDTRNNEVEVVKPKEKEEKTKAIVELEKTKDIFGSIYDKTAEIANRNLPTVSIVIFTHNRTNVAVEVIKSLVKNIVYPKLNWIISDDRSYSGHLEKLKSTFNELNIEPKICVTTKDHWGLGASMNNGLKEAFKTGDVVLRTEDDWFLEKKLFLRKYIEQICCDSRIAGIRMAMVGSNVHSESEYDVPGLKCLVGDYNSWIFNNQVMLVHKRIHDAIGWYKENSTADREENEFRSRYNSFTNSGREKLHVYSPIEMKWGTLDDPSLWFIHVGRSTLGHNVYREPRRYSWLYEAKKKTSVISEKIGLETRLDLDSTKNQFKPTTVEAKEKIEKKNTSNIFFPDISVLITTHNRTNVVCATIDSLCKNLSYSGNIHWIVSDDRSASGHLEKVKKQFLLNEVEEKFLTILNTDKKRFGLGASLNNGLKKAFSFGDVVLTTEDDWILQRSLNLNNYVKLIIENSIAAIRLACLRGGRPTISNKFPDFFLVKNYGYHTNDYVFNNQVALRHKRIYDKLGYYVETNDNNLPEKDMSNRYNKIINPSSSSEFLVLFPKELKIRTIDHPSLFFIHVGKSTIGNKEIVPKRYEYLYEQMNFITVLERRKISTKNIYIVSNQLDSNVNEPKDSLTFFRYLQKNEIPSKYLISAKHTLAESLKKEKDVVLLNNPMDKEEFLNKCFDALIHCKVYISEGTACNPEVFRFFQISTIKTIFMDHGIVNNWSSKLLANLMSKYKYLNVSSEKEKETVKKMVSDYGFKQPIYIVGGLPRFDVLKDLSDEKRNVMVMFSCRPSLTRDFSKFSKSLYLKNLLSLVSKLDKQVLERKIDKVFLAIHHQFVNRIPQMLDLFKDFKNVKIVDSNKISDAIEKSSILLTDVSSVSFDFFFLKRPVIFWALDMDDKEIDKADLEKILTSKTNIKNSLFNTVDSEEDLLTLLDFYLTNGMKLEQEKIEKTERFFRHKKDICENLYTVIETL